MLGKQVRKKEKKKRVMKIVVIYLFMKQHKNIKKLEALLGGFCLTHF